MTKSKRKRFTVMVDVSDDATAEEMRAYIEEVLSRTLGKVTVYSRPKRKSAKRKSKKTPKQFCDKCGSTFFGCHCDDNDSYRGALEERNKKDRENL